MLSNSLLTRLALQFGRIHLHARGLSILSSNFGTTISDPFWKALFPMVLLSVILLRIRASLANGQIMLLSSVMFVRLEGRRNHSSIMKIRETNLLTNLLGPTIQLRIF